MGARPLGLAAFVATATLLAGGCGGESELAGVPAAFVVEANAICAEREAELAEAGTALEIELNEGDATAVAAEVDEFQALAYETYADVSRLEAPEGEAGDAFITFAGAYEVAGGLAAQIAEAAATGDGDRVAELREQLEDVAAEQADAAAQLGLDDCVE